jgi:hypothetical protein
MNYPIFEQLARRYSNLEKELVAIDSFLANLNEKSKISPWRVSQKTNIPLNDVLKILLMASAEQLLTTRYEFWCPESSITIFDTFNLEEIKIGRVITCQRCSQDQHIVTKDNIHYSFKLNKVKNK